AESLVAVLEARPGVAPWAGPARRPLARRRSGGMPTRRSRFGRCPGQPATAPRDSPPARPPLGALPDVGLGGGAPLRPVERPRTEPAGPGARDRQPPR